MAFERIQERTASRPARLERDVSAHPLGERLLATYPHLGEALQQAYRKPGGQKILDVLHAIHAERAKASTYGAEREAAARFEDAVRAYATHGTLITRLSDDRGWGRTSAFYSRFAQLPSGAETTRLIGQALRLKPQSTVQSVQTRQRLDLLLAHSSLNPGFKYNSQRAESSAPQPIAKTRIRSAKASASYVESARRSLQLAQDNARRLLDEAPDFERRLKARRAEVDAEVARREQLQQDILADLNRRRAQRKIA